MGVVWCLSNSLLPIFISSIEWGKKIGKSIAAILKGEGGHSSVTFTRSNRINWMKMFINGLLLLAGIGREGFKWNRNLIKATTTKNQISVIMFCFFLFSRLLSSIWKEEDHQKLNTFFFFFLVIMAMMGFLWRSKREKSKHTHTYAHTIVKNNQHLLAGHASNHTRNSLIPCKGI